MQGHKGGSESSKRLLEDAQKSVEISDDHKALPQTSLWAGTVAAGL